MSFSNKQRDLMEKLKDESYRHEFVESNLEIGLAMQIRRLREERGWTQAELASKTGKKQSVISQLEDHDYGSYTLKTLKTLAKSYDVGLSVRFVAFSDLVQMTTDMTNVQISPPSFSDDELKFTPRTGWASVQLSSAVFETGDNTGNDSMAGLIWADPNVAIGTTEASQDVDDDSLNPFARLGVAV